MNTIHHPLLDDLTLDQVRELTLVGLTELDIFGHVRGVYPDDESNGWATVVGVHTADGDLVRGFYNPGIDERSRQSGGAPFAPGYGAALDAANMAPMLALARERAMSATRADHAAPLRPRGRRIWIVRWVRADGRETRHRVYLLRHPAERFCRRLQRSGRTAAIFSSDVDWTAGARP